MLENLPSVVAQMPRRHTSNLQVRGSIPSQPKFFKLPIFYTNLSISALLPVVIPQFLHSGYD